MLSRRFAAAFIVFIAVFSVTAILLSTIQFAHAEGTAADAMCKPEVKDQKEYNPSKPWAKTFTETRNGKEVPIFNLFGVRCEDKTAGKETVGHCLRENRCLADTTDGKTPDQEKPGEYCSTHPKECTGTAGEHAQPVPDGAGGQTPNLPQPPGGGAGDTPKPDANTMPKTDPLGNPLGEPLPDEKTPEKTPETNSFGDQLKQAGQSSGFLNTIENYFNPPDPLSPNSSGVSAFSPESVTQEGSNALGNTPSLYDQAVNPIGESTGFSPTPSSGGESQSWRAYMSSTVTGIGETLTGAYDTASKIASEAYSAVSDAAKSASDYIAQATGFADTPPTGADTNEFLNGTTPPDEFAGNDPNDLTPATTPPPGDQGTDLTPEQVQQINEQGLQDRLAQADRETAAYELALKDAENFKPAQEQAYTDPQKEVEKTNLAENLKEMGGGPPLDPETAQKLARLEIAREEQTNTQAQFEKQLETAKAQEAKLQEMNDKFNERWAPYRQCQDVCSNMDTTYDVRDAKEQAEFKQMQQELTDQQKVTSGEYAKAQDLLDNYKLTEQEIQGLADDKQVDDFLKQQTAISENRDQIEQRREYAEALKADIEKIAGPGKIVNEFGLNKDCWGVCKGVEVPNFDGNTRTIPLSEYMNQAGGRLDDTLKDIERLEARDKFLNSDDPLAAQTARTIAEGGYRGALAEGTLDKMLAEKPMADAARNGEYYHDPDAITREEDRRSQLERLTSGGDLTQLEQDALRKSQGMTEAELLESERLGRLGNGTIRAINDAGRLSGPESGLTAAEAQSRLFMSDSEVFNQQKSAWGEAGLRLGLDAANLALLPTGMAQGVTAFEAAYLGGRDLVATGITSSVAGAGERSFFSESAAGREAYMAEQVDLRASQLSRMETDLARGENGVTPGQVAAARADLGAFETRLAEMRGTVAADTAAYTGAEARLTSEITSDAAVQTEARVATEFNAARVESEMKAVETASEQNLSRYTVTEQQMQDLTRPLVAADTPLTTAERAALERYNITATEYARTQQLVAEGNLAQDSALARAAERDYRVAAQDFREAGLMERPGAITDTQHGLDNVYRASSGEVLASRANSYGIPSAYEVAGSRIPDAPIAESPLAARAAETPSVFDRATQPIRDFFAGERSAAPAFERPAFDTRPQTFTQTLERNVQDFFRLAEPAPAGSLTVAEARAMDTFNSVLAERSLPLPSGATPAGEALVASQRADAITRAIAGLTAEGLYQRADGPIVRGNGEVVAVQLPIQIPGQAPYAITAPLETPVRDLAIAENAALPSRAEQPAPLVNSGAGEVPPRTYSITAPPERGLLPGETVSPQVALRNALSAAGLFAALLNTTPAMAGSPDFNSCVAQMCLRPVTGNFSYYDPRKGGINVDPSAIRNGMALTKSGEPVSMNRNTNIDEHMTIASQRYPVNTIVKLCNGASCTFVRVNDTGSFEKYGRVGDLMPGPAKAIGFNIGKGVNVLTQIPVVAISGVNGNHQFVVNGIADGVLRDLNSGTPLTQALDNAAARSRNVFTYTLPQSNVAYVAPPGSAPGTQLAAARPEQTAPVTTAVTAPATGQLPVSNNPLTQIAKQGGSPQIPGVNKSVYLAPLDLVPASKWKNIVIHQSEGPSGTAASLAQQQAARPGKTGATIYVETDGTVYWATPEATSPSHIRGNRTDNAYISNAAIRGQMTNQNSIGIEFTGNFPDVAKPLTDAQMKSGVALVKFLQERYGIRADNVYAHNWIDYKDERYNEGAQLATEMRKIAYVPGQTAQLSDSAAPVSPVTSKPAPDFETRLQEALAQENAKRAAELAAKPKLSVTEELEQRLAARNQQQLDQTSRATRPAPVAAPTPSWTPITFAPAPITQPYISSPPKILNLPPVADPAPVDLSDVALVPKEAPVADIQPTVSRTVQKPAVLVDGAVNVPPVNAIDPAPIQSRLEIARADVQKAQAQADAIQSQLTPLMKKFNDVSKQELVIETAEKNLASMNTGRVLLNSINGQPNPAQMATLRASAGGASRLSNNVKQLGDSGLASELRGYVNFLNWLAKPENQSQANADKAKAIGSGLINRAQRVIDQATARADAVGDSDVLAKQQKVLLAELSTATKNLNALKNIEQSTAAQLAQTPGVTIKQVEPAPETVPPTQVPPVETKIAEEVPPAETAIVDETPKFVRAPEEEQKLALPPTNFSPTFTQFPYDQVGNPPVYEIANPIVLKGTLTAALGAYTYLPQSIRDVLADVTAETKSISFTKDELDAIQWGKMDKSAYQFVLRQFNHDPTLQTGYVPPVASSDRVAGPQLFADIRANVSGETTNVAVAAEQTAPVTEPVGAPATVPVPNQPQVTPTPNEITTPIEQGLINGLGTKRVTRGPTNPDVSPAQEQTAPVTAPVNAPPTAVVDAAPIPNPGTVPATLPSDAVAQPTRVEKFFTRLASGEQIAQTLNKGFSYTYQWAKEKIFGAAPSIQIGKLSTAPYEASVPTGSTAQYVCASGAACARGSASGLFVSTEPGRTYVQVAVEGTKAVDTTALLNTMKEKGVNPVMNAAGPFVTSVQGGQSVQDIAYNKGVSVGANASATGRDGLVITNSEGKMMIANKRQLAVNDFEQLGISVPDELKGKILNIVGNEADFKVIDAIMKDNQLSAITNLLLVENGKLNPAVNDPYTSRRLLVVMPDGTTGILSSVENARTNDFAKVAQAMGAKYAVNLDTGFYDEATVHLQDGTPKSIGTAGSDNHAHGVVAIGVTHDTAPVQRTDVAPTTNVTVDRPAPEQTAPVTTPVEAPAKTPTPNQSQIDPTPNALRPDEIELNTPKPNTSGALPPPEPNQLPAVTETQTPKPSTSGSIVAIENTGVPRPNETESPSIQTPRPNNTIDDFSVTEIMPDGSVRTLRPDVTTPGSNVPAHRGGGGGIVPPIDPTWRPYFEPPVPGQYIGPASNLPWWTIGSIGGIAATLTTIAMLSPDDHPDTPVPVETARPADETAPVTTPVEAKPEEKKEPPCTERANTRDNMLRKLLGDSLSEVDCVPTPENILNNEPLPRIPDLQPVTTGPGTVPPTTITRPPGTVPPGTTTLPPGTGPGTGGGSPTGNPGAPTGGTNAGSNSSPLSKLMSFLAGFLKGMGGSAPQQPQPMPPQPIPVPVQPRGTSTPVAVQITVEPNPVHAGDGVRVSWTSVGASVCRATDSQGIHMATGTPDSAVAFTAPATTSAYFIACTNTAGQIATNSVTLIIR